MLHVVVGLVFNDQHQVLIAKRLAHQDAGGLWEFPGGKVEAGEHPLTALIREFDEEVGIKIHQASPFFSSLCESTGKKIFLDTWLVHHFEGSPVGCEGQLVRWIHINELKNYSFPVGNLPIIEKIFHVKSERKKNNIMDD